MSSSDLSRGTWLARYLQGFHQEVYDELLALGEQVFAEPFSYEALLVAREIMRRVKYNITVLLPRLHTLGYQFGVGFFEGMTPEERASAERDVPIYREPDEQAREKVQTLEQFTGTLPLALKYWYEEVGSVNLVGAFPSMPLREALTYGTLLDPLFVYSIDMALQMVRTYIEMGVWNAEPLLPLSPDNYYKYGFSGTGTYAIRLPCQAFDAPLLLERHRTTFTQYLRHCFQWAGFPGLEVENRLPAGTLEYVTEGLLPF